MKPRDWRHGLQSAPCVSGQAEQAGASPELAVAWQSAAAELSAAQLVAQKVKRSSQLRSGSAPPSRDGSSGESAGGAGGAMHALPRTISADFVQLRRVPLTQALSPHASVRCSVSFSARQVQSVSGELQDGVMNGRSAVSASHRTRRAERIRET
jgi:hypothetical protein